MLSQLIAEGIKPILCDFIGRGFLKSGPHFLHTWYNMLFSGDILILLSFILVNNSHEKDNVESLIIVVVWSLSCTQLFFDAMDCRPPGSLVHGTFQARILKWWPFPSPGDRPNPGIKPATPAFTVDLLPLSHWGSPVTEMQTTTTMRYHLTAVKWLSSTKSTNNKCCRGYREGTTPTLLMGRFIATATIKNSMGK